TRRAPALPGILAPALASPLWPEGRAGLDACGAQCEYYSVCGGGSPVNKLFENGSFTGTTTSFCTLTQMVPTDLILEAYDRLEQSWVEPDPVDVIPANSPTTAEAAALSPRMP